MTIKIIYKKIMIAICYIFLILFMCWLILGLGYRGFYQDIIQEKQQSMLKVLTDIKIFNNYTVVKIEPQQVSRALISQICKAYFDTNQPSDTSIYEIENYLLKNCWSVKKTRHKDDTYSLEAKQDDFIVVIENVNDSTVYNLIVTVKYDDFFTHYSL